MKTKLLRLSIFAALFNLVVSCSADDSTSENAPEAAQIVLDYQYSSSELEAMTLINEYRSSLGLRPLEKINHISYKSEEHDNYMISNNVVNHNDFDARAANITKVLKAKDVAENIAYNYNSPKAALDAWLRSESHKKNIEGDYTHFGLAIRESPINGKKYYTNIFVKI